MLICYVSLGLNNLFFLCLMHLLLLNLLIPFLSIKPFHFLFLLFHDFFLLILCCGLLVIDEQCWVIGKKLSSCSKLPFVFILLFLLDFFLLLLCFFFDSSVFFPLHKYLKGDQRTQLYQYAYWIYFEQVTYFSTRQSFPQCQPSLLRLGHYLHLFLVCSQGEDNAYTCICLHYWGSSNSTRTYPFQRLLERICKLYLIQILQPSLFLFSRYAFPVLLLTRSSVLFLLRHS